MYLVYILECQDGSLYTGITNDLQRRLKQHQAGKGGHYTRAKGALKVVYTEERPSRSSALRREAEIKRWPRKQKLMLVCHTIGMENKHKAAGKEAMVIKKQKALRVKQKRKKGK